MSMKLFSSLTLPNGATISNRLAKATMEENMADADHAPSDALLRLYDAWAQGGAGLILTGNVMVDSRAIPDRTACRSWRRIAVRTSAHRHEESAS
jgi:2,4-dienoyl-CoA reductase-like NADH-dependent reductase (Old Yellow Enzyme family)